VNGVETEAPISISVLLDGNDSTWQGRN
jgi:hypothetical protein